MENLEELLDQLGFTALESRIYLCLLQNGEQTGYQIAKRLGAHRASVYPALQSMYDKGFLLRKEEAAQSYIAENPRLLMDRVRRDVEKRTAQAVRLLQPLYESRHEEQFINLQGQEAILARARSMIQEARQEVVMNTDFDLHEFEAEFRALRSRGGRVIVFSFAQLNQEGLDIEFFTHSDPICDSERPSRLMLVSDRESTLIADGGGQRQRWLGTLTNNPLMVSIISEHIHNDIYLLKLKEHHGELIDDSILLHMLQEQPHE